MTHSIKDIQTYARDLFVLMQQDNVSLEQQESLEKWLDEDPVHRAAYQQYAQTWQQIELLGKSEYAGKLKASYERSEGNFLRDNFSWLINKFVISGAALTTCCLLGIIVITQYLGSPKTTTYTSAKGEIKSVELPDGSVVTLSGNSHITYKKEGVLRRVELISGEAFFDVKTAKESPLSVSAGGIKIKVVGTQFNVNAGVDRIRVDVLEGVVKVSCQSDDSKQSLEPIRLVAGQSVVKSKLGELEKKSVRLSDIAPWKNGRLRYKAVPLKELLYDVNRYYSGEIILADKSLENENVSASFNIENIGDFPEAISDLLPVKPIYGKNGQVVLVRSYK